ncbi:MAG: HD domain-containing protein [Candidatus Coatesbacteria bacterium]|nr:HD domain-containing protein [Candidatus Coatesbacteria bacterium]
MEIRDPVHGFISVYPDERQIVDLPIFQRLRGIKQLAMAYLVYPGDMHTRFEHSLGVYHIASRMAEALLPGESNRRNRRIVSFAALLHDIGHGPFSHVSDDVFGLIDDSGLPASPRPAHEHISASILRHDPDLNRIMSQNDIKDVIALLKGEDSHLSVMREIISGAFDADTMDYLLRDSHFCGVKFGVFDIDRIISTLRTHPERGDHYLAVQDKGVNSLEQFILARYFMTTQVYTHKVRSITDSMIARGIELGLREGVGFLETIYHYEDSPEFVGNYLRWDDARVVDAIVSDKRQGLCSELFSRLEKRRLFKRVFRASIRTLEAPEQVKIRLKAISSARERKLRDDLETAVSKLEHIDCKEEFVIAKCVVACSVRGKLSRGEDQLSVSRENGDVRRFIDTSAVFGSIDEIEEDRFLELYAPLDVAGKTRDALKREIEQEVMRILRQMGEDHGD